jgi:hypothetical protein
MYKEGVLGLCLNVSRGCFKGYVLDCSQKFE